MDNADLAQDSPVENSRLLLSIAPATALSSSGITSMLLLTREVCTAILDGSNVFITREFLSLDHDIIAALATLLPQYVRPQVLPAGAS
ncbi:hypothetical protein [Ensifer aridi]|uniref:hypothetical protein n=1 Tax=Ensifer aridi TaxID=1708715 RepID=UPI001FCDE2AB|nr:hypothetical protein [Ensifer aridi]